MRVVIVDDEPLARARLVWLCQRETHLEVVAEAESGAAAIDAIRSHHPEVVLLDVELRDMTGFDVLRSLKAQEEPLAIMVTAHVEHAVQAFDSGAVDYLTKPVGVQRFGVAINRVRQWHARGTVVSVRDEIIWEMRASGAERAQTSAPPRQLVGEKGLRLHFIEPQSVDFFESDGNHVSIHVGEDRYIARNSVKHLAEVLAPLGFIRIERALLLNLRRVAFAERMGNGAFAFTLRGGRRLVSGRTYRPGILSEIRAGQLIGRQERR